MIKKRSTPYHRTLIEPESRQIYDNMLGSISKGELEMEFDLNDSPISDPLSIRRILSGVLNDNPSIFWINNSVLVGRNGDTVKVTFEPNQFYDDRDNLLDEVESRSREILEGIGPFTDDYTTSLTIHDHLTSNITYQDSNDPRCHCVIGPLLDSKGVCDGISDTYNLLMNMAGVRCTTVHGRTHDDDIGHSWNISILEGDAYHTDVTFDLGGSHRYLNLNDDIMSFTHRFNRYIHCQSLDANYHSRNSTLFDTVDQADSYIRSNIRGRGRLEFMVLEPSDNRHFLDVVSSTGSDGDWSIESSSDGRGFTLMRKCLGIRKGGLQGRLGSSLLELARRF